MRVQINKPNPIPAPPETVDIFGLPKEDAQKLCALLGRLGCGQLPGLYSHLFSALYGFPGTDEVRYSVTDNNRELGVIQIDERS